MRWINSFLLGPLKVRENPMGAFASVDVWIETLAIDIIEFKPSPRNPYEFESAFFEVQ